MQPVVRFVAALAWAMSSAIPQASGFVVERIIDGDTVVVTGIGTVRLIGVDAPEMDDQRPDVRALAIGSATGARQLLEGRRVLLSYDQTKTDRFGRTLAYLHFVDGTFVNAELIRSGYAQAYTKYPFQHMEAFRSVEREARTSGRGLWASAAASGIASLREAQAPAAAVDDKTTVYVTKTGKKYHRSGCRSLSKSRIAMPLAEAAEKYGPCGVCKPPVLGPGATKAGAARPAPRATPAPAASGRCQATTKKGTQCSRRAAPGSTYCWQHGGRR